MKKAGRPKKSKQLKFRSTKFQFDQYWNVHYTEKSADGAEKDYKTIIKSRSADLAKQILKNKIREDSPGSKIKSLFVFMFHKDGEINAIGLSIEDWRCIKEASFPNEVNILFKYESSRPEGYTNRFNYIKQGSKPKNGFKKGHAYIPQKNQYSNLEKAHMKWNGKWLPWPREDREALKEKIIINFRLHNNSRVKTAKALGYLSSKPLKKLLNSKFIEIDWEKDYPPPKQELKYRSTLESRMKGILKAKKVRVEKILPQIKKLLKEGLPKSRISKKLNISGKTLNSYLNSNYE